MSKRRRTPQRNNEDMEPQSSRLRQSENIANFDAMKDNNLSQRTKETYSSKVNGLTAFLSTLDPNDDQWYSDGFRRCDKFVTEEGK